MRQALNKALRQAKSSPIKVKDMLDLASGSVSLDNSLGLQDLLDLAHRFRDFGGDKLHTYALPINEVGPVGSAKLYPNMPAAEPILNVFRGLPIDEVGPSLITVDVLNGSGKPDQALNVAGALQSIGFEVGQPGSAPAQALTTAYYAPGQQAYGKRVARHVTGGAVLAERPGLAAGHVQLVTGANFTTIHETPIPADKLPTPTTTAPPPPPGASTTPTTAAPTTTTAATTTTTAPPAPPPATPTIGYAAGQPPPGVDCH
jgi:hypothetical protein